LTAVPDGGVRPRERAAEADALPAGQLYARLLATAVAHAAGGPPPPRSRLRSEDGSLDPMPLERWLAPTSPVDDRIVARAQAPVLDVGCGPGRLLEALALAGKPALGVDLVPAAVGIARARGGRVVEGSIFAEVPGAGTWATALLFDGNIGIGGWPAALLERVAGLLRPGGEAFVEVDPPGSPTRMTNVRIESDGVVSEWFAWAQVAADAMAPIAEQAGMRERETLEDEGRWFCRLARS